MARVLKGSILVATLPMSDVDSYFSNEEITDRAGYDIQPNEAELKTIKKAEKLAGVEFEGVMCSATSTDESGLTGRWLHFMAAKMQGQTADPVNFHFANGNSLVLTSENIDAFASAWKAFRGSFFPLPE